MIQKHLVEDGIILRIRPFSRSNRNATCEIITKVTSANGSRRNARVYFGGLGNARMTLSDLTILMTAMRAIGDETRKQMEAVQEGSKAAHDVSHRAERRKAWRKRRQ